MLAIATVLLCVGTSVYLVIISRLLQGLSTAAVYSIGLALLVDTVGRDEVGQWMGFALSSSSIGLVVSPVLGGLVYSQAGYYAVFVMILGIIAIDIVLRLVAIEKKVAAKWISPAASNGNGNGNGNNGYATFPGYPNHRHESNVHSDDVSSNEQTNQNGVSRGIDTRSEQSKKKKFQMPTTIILLKSPRLVTAVYGVFVQVAILASFDTLLPLFVKQTFDWGPFQAGLVFLNIAIPALAGPLAGRLSDNYGPRWIAISGFLLTVPPLVLMRLVKENTQQDVLLLCGLLVLTGVPPNIP